MPFLVELGVMTAAGDVRAQRHDKFRQVNRFLELVEDVLPSLPEGPLQVVDFGSGRSYLTFAAPSPPYRRPRARGRDPGARPQGGRRRRMRGAGAPARSGWAAVRARRHRERTPRGCRSRREPARLRHRDRCGARPCRSSGRKRHPRGSLLPARAPRPARPTTGSSRFCVTGSSASGSPPEVTDAARARLLGTVRLRRPAARAVAARALRRRTSSCGRRGSTAPTGARYRAARRALPRLRRRARGRADARAAARRRAAR